MDTAELRARLTLRVLPGLRSNAINRLIDEHGSAHAALSAPAHILELGAQTLPDAAVRGRVAACENIIRKLGVTVLCADDARYPWRLRERLGRNRPAMLFCLGDIRFLDDIGIAIVGSRAMSDYGRRVAEQFAGELSHAGLCITSGLARGVDAAGHEAALDAGGDTIAVVGNGIDVTYPASNRMLRQRIIRRGVVVSQFLPMDRPTRWNFPERNLVMAALSDGVLVVEAAARSGATITANHAGEYGIDAMAVPGPIDQKTSVGSNQLIREGVTCVTSVAEVLEVMDRPGRREALAEQLLRRASRRSGQAPAESDAASIADRDDRLYSPEAMRIRDALRGGAAHLDNVAATTGLPIPNLLSTLVELEIAGVVRQHAGSRFELRQTVTA